MTGSELKKKHVKAVYCHPAYLLYMQSTSCKNARLDDSQAGIKFAGRNINNLRYADDITLMAESEEELKSLLLRVKEESEKSGLKFNISVISSAYLRLLIFLPANLIPACESSSLAFLHDVLCI